MNKTVLYRMLLIAFLMIGVSGCKKEELNSGEMVAQELQEVIDSQNIEYLRIYFLENSYTAYMKIDECSIHGQFLETPSGSTTVNLDLLKFYQVTTQFGPGKLLLLYFY